MRGHNRNRPVNNTCHTFHTVLITKLALNTILRTMRMIKIQLENAPSTPVEQDASVDDASRSIPSTPASTQSSPESCYSRASGFGNHWQSRRRRRGPARNVEKRPYHSPTHVSPPHDAPMTKNDMYFALDCEVSISIFTRSMAIIS